MTDSYFSLFFACWIVGRPFFCPFGAGPVFVRTAVVACRLSIVKPFTRLLPRFDFSFFYSILCCCYSMRFCLGFLDAYSGITLLGMPHGFRRLCRSYRAGDCIGACFVRHHHQTAPSPRSLHAAWWLPAPAQVGTILGSGAAAAGVDGVPKPPADSEVGPAVIPWQEQLGITTNVASSLFRTA